MANGSKPSNNQAKSSKPKPPKKKSGGGTSTATLAAGVGALACCVGMVLLWETASAKAPLEPPPKVEPVRAARKSAERTTSKSRPDDAPSAQASCKSKAATGECNGHQASWMRQHCRAECEEWQGMTQIQRECAGYAEVGECSRNPAYMLHTCGKECKAWEEANGLRIDRDSNCVDWSLLGKCAREPERMSRECNTSCTIQERCQASSFTGWPIGQCDKALRCELKDKDDPADCRARALRGECATRDGAGRAWDAAMRMAERCHASCAEIDIDGLMSAQRSEFRVRRAPLLDETPARTSVSVPAPASASPPSSSSATVRVDARRYERCWLPGWKDTGHNKLALPTRCAAPRRLPWQRRRTPRARWHGDAADELLCPIDVKRYTPRVLGAPTRAVSVPPHTPHAVIVQHVLPSPRVRLLHDFLTADEAAELLRLSQPLFQRSPVRSVATDRRTSSTATLGRNGGAAHAEANWAVRRVRQRIAAFSGYDLSMLEPLQVVRYHPGEKYEAHHDSFDTCDFAQRPRRHLTFLIYLNELEGDAGGHTAFPRLGVQVRPRARSALVFNDVLDSGQDDVRTEHAGSPPAKGVKYAINCWIRAGPIAAVRA